MSFLPIGIIHTSFSSLEGIPIQPAAAPESEGWIELSPDLVDGLKDLEGFSHLILITHLHANEGVKLQVKPFMEDALHGVFATRAPKRPNPIGLSVVKLERIEGNHIHFLGADMLDGTPLLDIKPFIPAFDHPEDVRVGWLEAHLDELPGKRADGRFTENPQKGK